jgi:hypothetical protein
MELKPPGRKKYHMKNTLMRRAVLLGVILLLASMGFMQIPAAAQGLIPTPTVISSDPPPPSAGDPAVWFSGGVWYNGVIQYSLITNCTSIILGSPYTEYGAGTSVGYYGESTIGMPGQNMVYYIHVIVTGLGNACAGQYAYIDIGLPANTLLAISATNPVNCLVDGVALTLPEDCPQILPPSSNNNGMYTIPSTNADWTWPIAQGHNWEFQIPVVSTTTFSNGTLQAKVWMIDGNSNPWLNPTQGVHVFAALPLHFAKSSPPNGATNQRTNPTLSWGASPNANYYEYCLSTAGCTWASTWVPLGNVTSKALSGLTPGVKYYWQVRARNALGITGSDDGGPAWSFTIGQVPAAPTLISPSGVITDTTPLYQWNASAGASSYRIGVYSVSSASYVILKEVSSSYCSGGVCNYTPSKVLSAGNYQLKVQSRNVIGYSAWSAWKTFTVMTTPPATPTLTSPSGVITDTHPPYTWNSSTGATDYRIGVYSVASGTYVILTDVAGSACTRGVCTYHPSTVLAPGNYQFKVLAKNAIGFSAYSTWNYFTVMTTTPAVPTPTSPSGTIADHHPPYVWNASTGATSYRIGVYSVATASYVILTDVASSACAGGVCTYHPATVLAAGNYRFKVLARNAIGASAYSAWMNFIISP